ncbi:MAG TPA: hypothetical protein VHH33_03960 [Nitrososphaeraceae archaeon]|jgi:hypothetical protein|nr:hypothetical protein [Nitrososphaeraceae archaeon]
MYTTAANHLGISGKIVLNDAGDGINGNYDNYDIWSVVKSDRVYIFGNRI